MRLGGISRPKYIFMFMSGVMKGLCSVNVMYPYKLLFFKTYLTKELIKNQFKI